MLKPEFMTGLLLGFEANAPATATAIEAAEREMGLRFQNSYREFLTRASRADHKISVLLFVMMDALPPHPNARIQKAFAIR